MQFFSSVFERRSSEAIPPSRSPLTSRVTRGNSSRAFIEPLTALTGAYRQVHANPEMQMIESFARVAAACQKPDDPNRIDWCVPGRREEAGLGRDRARRCDMRDVPGAEGGMRMLSCPGFRQRRCPL
jgi:hypothetical protein